MKARKYLSALFTLGLILSLLPLAACSKDDDEPGFVNYTDLFGTWQGVSSSGWEKEDGEVIDRWNDDESFAYDFIKINYDATGEWWSEGSSYKHEFTWYIDDDSKLVIGERVVGDGTGEYYRIKTLTKDKLVLISEDDDPDDGWYQEDTYKRIN